MLLNTPICNFGWQAPDFTLAAPGGETHTVSSYVGQQGVLVVFLCNHCLYVQAIADRLATDAQTLQRQGIAVLGVMSNDDRSAPSTDAALCAATWLDISLSGRRGPTRGSFIRCRVHPNWSTPWRLTPPRAMALPNKRPL